MKTGLLAEYFAVAVIVVPAQSFAEEYQFTDKWSSDAQRAVWTNNLQIISETPVWAKFHLLGHLHALSCTIPLSSVEPADLRVFLLSTLRSLFFLPGSWSQVPLLQPYQNRHVNPSVDYFQLVLGATTSTSSFCSPYPPPCGAAGGKTYVFGPEDVDGAVYAHEYAHPFLAVTKTLHSQIGYDGQSAEGWCDIVGVALENIVLSARQPCPALSSCVAPRTTSC